MVVAAAPQALNTCSMALISGIRIFKPFMSSTLLMGLLEVIRRGPLCHQFKMRMPELSRT